MTRKNSWTSWALTVRHGNGQERFTKHSKRVMPSTSTSPTMRLTSQATAAMGHIPAMLNTAAATITRSIYLDLLIPVQRTIWILRLTPYRHGRTTGAMCGALMEEKIINMNQFLGAAQGDQEHMLGKFLYFSLANLLVDKDELSSLCESMGIPYTGSTRLSLGDAFRSATGDIRERVPVTVDGETNIYLAYCRDNKRTAGVFSRELVKETLNRETNRYEKLANISCGKNDGMFRCDNLVLDDAVDVQGCCRKAEELFELYQRCANRKQIETICVNFLRGMEATKLSVTGHMYFVPRTFMERVDIFEDFITLLSGLNKKQTPLVVNSFYIIDDAKQRDKMTEEFYLAVKKEIAAYQEKCDYLIKSSSQSPAVMERWVLKVQALEEKKRHYEGVLQRELDGLDDEFSVLKLLSQELQVRANGIRNLRFQQRAA